MASPIKILVFWFIVVYGEDLSWRAHGPYLEFETCQRMNTGPQGGMWITNGSVSECYGLPYEKDNHGA